MPNKADKYSIKFWVLVDVKAKYVANITPHLGAQKKKVGKLYHCRSPL